MLSYGECKIAIVSRVCDAIGIVLLKMSLETFRRDPDGFSWMPPDIIEVHPVVVTQCHVDVSRGEYVVFDHVSLSKLSLSLTHTHTHSGTLQRLRVFVLVRIEKDADRLEINSEC
ncbi:hypothetical protein OAV88_03695 [bacterium]|nr:hypothetical protein [bacterium]